MTALFWLGRLVEFDKTEQIFTNAREQTTEDYVTRRLVNRDIAEDVFFVVADEHFRHQGHGSTIYG